MKQIRVKKKYLNISEKSKVYFAFFIVLVMALQVLSISAQAVTFTVDSTTDAVDAGPGDGTCASAAAQCNNRLKDKTIKENRKYPGISVYASVSVAKSFFLARRIEGPYDE